MNIFVAKLSQSTTSESLRELFEEYGQVDSAKVIMDRERGRSKGFGFVEMSDDDGAGAIKVLDGLDFEGSSIVVQEAKPRENNSGGGYRRDNRNRY